MNLFPFILGPVCEKLFDVDDFQRLQPGLILRWRNNLQEEKNERERKSTLRSKQQVLLQTVIFHPHTLINSLFASYIKGVLADLPAQEGNRNDGLNEIDEIEDPTQENRQLRTHTRGESCVYSSCFSDGKCSICRAEHFDCNFMNNKQQCSLCFKVSEECPAYASKAKYVVDKLLQLRNCDLHGMTSASYNVSPHAARLFSKPGFLYSKHRPLKAIAFSQFQSIYEYFGDRLIRRFGGACVADYSYGGTRTEELQKFVHDPNCFVMLLSKQGSHGLDLSFVTHIFFLGECIKI